MSKKIVPVSVLSIFILLILVFQVCAITGAIGNARMVLRVNAGEKIEKYILVKNVNDVPLNIELSAEGDLKDYIDIKDKEFKLNAGEEKKAYFTLTAKAGSTESKINIKFIPEAGSGEKNGVGLSATIIVITNANESGGNADDNLSYEENDTDQSQKTGIDVITSKFAGLSGGGSRSTALIILASMTIIIFIILIVLIIIKNRMAKKNQEEIKEEKEVKEVKSKTKKSAKRSG